jgi:hypothetical protein
VARPLGGALGAGGGGSRGRQVITGLHQRPVTLYERRAAQRARLPQVGQACVGGEGGITPLSQLPYPAYPACQGREEEGGEDEGGEGEGEEEEEEGGVGGDASSGDICRGGGDGVGGGNVWELWYRKV